MNVCKNCGTEFEGKFCPECGTKYDSSSYSSDTTLGASYEGDTGLHDMICSAYDAGSLSLEAKERNILEHVKRLLGFGGFDEACRELGELEKEEVSRLGMASAAVYYYKLLAKSCVATDDELVEKIVSADSDIKSDIDYRMSRTSPECAYKDRINDIERHIRERFGAIRAEEE